MGIKSLVSSKSSFQPNSLLFMFFQKLNGESPMCCLQNKEPTAHVLSGLSESTMYLHMSMTCREPKNKTLFQKP
jgi:hypothetical protein